MESNEKVQVRLKSDCTYLTAWVDKPVRPRQLITLKDSDDPNRWWEVLSVGKPKKSTEIKHKWGMTDIPRGQTPRVV